MGWRSGLLIVIFVFGVLFSMIYFSGAVTNPRTTIIIIPEGSSNPNSEHHNFEPATVTVVIGVNNTVRWINQDSVPSAVLASSEDDPDFLKATDEKRNSDKPFLMPGDTFEYTFTKAGEFGYHSEPHPWKNGLVIVLPG